MGRRTLLMSAVVVALALGTSTSYADSYTSKYSVGFVGVTGVAGGRCVSVGDPDLGDVGCARFAAFDGTPASLTIADTTGGPIAVTIAQDFNGNNTFGEAGIDPRVNGCGTSFDLSTSAIPFQPEYEVLVFVYTVRQAVPCAGSATHGTATLATA